MSRWIHETFDSVFKTIHRQGRRVDDLEKMVQDLQKQLAEKDSSAAPKPAAAAERESDARA